MFKVGGKSKVRDERTRDGQPVFSVASEEVYEQVKRVPFPVRLGELAGLDPEMTVRPWVAFSGLDPVHHRSGSSVAKPSRISRQGSVQLRHALFMPALVGVRCDPALRAFYHQLQQRQKPKMQARIAVARKILHAIYGIFKTGTNYDGAKLFPSLRPSS